jgi:hypothetical protein
MTLTIDVGPEQEARLLEEAARQGLDARDYVQRIIEYHLPPRTGSPPLNTPTAPEERARAFRAWAESQRLDPPLLSDEAISRESIYGEHG